MSKSPVTKEKKDNTKYEKFTEKLQSVNLTFCDFRELILKNIFKDITGLIAAKAVYTIKNAGKLAKYDEQIYDHYKLLVDYYKSYMELYEQKKALINSENVKKIIEGIYSVLVSQVRQFNEALKASENDEYMEDANPIRTEKINIIKKTIGSFSNKTEQLKNSCGKFFEKVYKFGMQKDSDFEREIRKIIIDEYRDEIYMLYTDVAKSCLSRLNDIASRNVTSSYYELLKEERSDLSSIIKVQIEVLENEPQTVDEAEIIQEFLKNLRECYQHISKKTDSLEHMFKDFDKQDFNEIAEKNDDEFFRAVIEDYDRSFFDEQAEQMSLILKDLREFFNREFFDKESGLLFKEQKDYSKIQADVKKEIEFAKALNEKFKLISDYTKKNKEKLFETEFKDIINGIFETIEIKVENIEENTRDFENNCLEFINKSFDKEFEISEKEKNKFFEVVLKSCFEKDLSKVSFEKVLNESFGQKFELCENEVFDNINKKIIQFLREQLLFEISTFEEILNYSITRLRGSENEAVREYVALNDDVTEAVSRLLNKFGVEVIRPKPHDIFDGKFHDVLMAEKNEAFKKGEIIKLMNSGYKKGDNIILRANVIAAK